MKSLLSVVSRNNARLRWVLVRPLRAAALAEVPFSRARVALAVLGGTFALLFVGGTTPGATAQAAGLSSFAAFPRDEPHASAPAVCPSSIVFGETIQCSITTGAEADTYTFAATAGDKVLVRMSPAAGGTLFPDVRVYGPDAAKLCDEYSSGTAEIASCSLPSTGTYSILALDDFGTGTGGYELYLQRLNNPGNAVSGAFGHTLSGSITTGAEADTYTFAATAGDKVLVRMSPAAGGTLFPDVRVYGPDAAKLCDEYSSGTAEIASCSLPSTGTYSILALDDFGTGTGGYELYLQRLNNPGNAVSGAFGHTLSGSITTGAEADTYTFAATAGDKVLVRMSPAAGGTLFPDVRVYGPDAAKLCDEYSSGTAEIASCSLPSTGTYSILALDDFGTGTGGYELYLQRLNNPGNAVSGAFGHTLSGSITTGAEADTYTFAATAGDKVLVRMSPAAGGTLFPDVRVYGPDAAKLCDEYSSGTAEIASCSLPSTGTYSILALDDFGTGTGGYELYLQRLNNPGNAVSGAFGHTLSGSITTGAEADTYTFAATGDKVLVRMSPAAGGTLFPDVRVYGPDAAKLCDEYSSGTAEIASCSLPSTGTYSILALDDFGTGTGGYELYLQRLNNPGNAVSGAFGHTLSGSITTGAEADTYTFAATAGDKVLVRMSPAAGGTLFPDVRVYGPDAAKLCDEYSSGTAEIASCSLPSTGTYSILALDDFGTGTGGYEFSIVPGAAKTFTVSTVSAWVAGTTHTVTITAKDAYGNTATGYTDKIHLASSDPAAVLPADYTFTRADGGVHTFNVILKTAGARSVTATDTGIAFVQGSDAGIVVQPAAASTLVVSGLTTPRSAGLSGSIRVTAKDPYGNTATGYRGTVHFSSTDPAAVLPSGYTFTSADAGTRTFGVTLKTVGTRSVTATDTVTSSIHGAQSSIVVNPGSASRLSVTGFPGTSVAGSTHALAVRVLDAYGNTATSYRGKVHFTSTDPVAVLPADYTFTASDAGTHTFSVTLKTAGAQSVSATDMATVSIKGSQTGIVVTPAKSKFHLVTPVRVLDTRVRQRPQRQAQAGHADLLPGHGQNR